MAPTTTGSRTIDGAALDAVLTAAVAEGGVPHVVGMVADRDGVLYEGAAGSRALGQDDRPVDSGTLFRLMSMTKMVTTVVALQQAERGELDLSAPVADYRPEFADLPVLDGFDGDVPRLRAPRSAATVQQLLTHTAGLSYWFWNADVVRYEALTGLANVVPGRLEALRAPLVADPGTRFEYGIGTDWLGLVVEAAGGAPLDRLVAEGVTGPLGMADTVFVPGADRAGDVVSVHVPADGGWASIGEILNQEPEWWSGGGGLYSTPRDYLRFERALLRDGELDGVRILGAASVDAAFRNQIGDLRLPARIPTADPAASDDFEVGDEYTWGYGLLLNTRDEPGRRRAWTGSWSGLLNTHFLVDRTTGVCASLWTNALPFVARDGAWRLYRDFERAVYAAL